MTLAQITAILRQRWTLVVAVAVLGVALSAALHLLLPPSYTARLTMYVSAAAGDTPQTAAEGAQLSQDRVKSYAELVTSDRILDDVITALGLPGTPQDLAKKVQASSSDGSVLIQVSATSDSPGRAADIVNQIGSALPSLVDELERPTSSTNSPPVAVRVVKLASPPTESNSLGLPVALALGLASGLAIGGGVAITRHLTDQTIRTSDRLGEISGAPELATLLLDPNNQQKIVMAYAPQAPSAEAYRSLRANLQYIDIGKQRTIVSITSASESEGKTTVACNLALALAATGARVCIIDADLRKPKIAQYLGLESAIGLSTVLSGRAGVDQVLQPWAHWGVEVITSGSIPPNPNELAASEPMQHLLEHLRQRYDYIIVDSPPLLPVADGATISTVVDGTIICCQYGKTRAPDLRDALGRLRRVGGNVFGTVLTMTPAKLSAYSRRYGTYSAGPER